jgi:transcriptional regulator with XRE-family HTH domain
MSFLFDVGARARTASRLIGNLRSDLIAAVIQHRAEGRLTQQQLAELIGISRTDLNGILSGQKELTLRSVADIALALNKEVFVELRDPATPSNGNYFASDEQGAPIARQIERRETITRSSSRAMRTFVAPTYSDRDD